MLRGEFLRRSILGAFALPSVALALAEPAVPVTIKWSVQQNPTTYFVDSGRKVYAWDGAPTGLTPEDAFVDPNDAIDACSNFCSGDVIVCQGRD